MFEDLCIFVGVPAILSIITYFAYQYIHSGLTAPVEVSLIVYICIQSVLPRIDGNLKKGWFSTGF